MKRMILLAAMALLPLQAHAWLKVVNLSSEPQYVSFYFAGTVTTKMIPVNGYQFFSGSDGMLSIDVSKQTVKGSQAQPGVLTESMNNITANNRTAGIPASDQDIFVIWPDGRLLFQQRQKGWGPN